MDWTVVIGTYGESSWARLALERAWPSAVDQAHVVHSHAKTLAQARNAALERVDTEWVVHLDADDELEPGFIETLAQGHADLRAPAVRYAKGARFFRPRMPQVAGHQHICSAECLPEGNWLVVGTGVRADLVREVGGWREFSWSEDWDLWLRCWLAGASVEGVPDAIYRAHVRPDSRNRAPLREERQAAHEAIYAANFPHHI